MTELVRVVSLVVLFAIPVLLAYRSFLVYKNQLALIRDLDVARIQGRQWRDETRAILKGLGEAIDRQFLTWKLTEAERDVGLLILKGLSLKEIAAVRVTSERTIRAQARSTLREGRPERPCRPLGVLPGGSARTNRARQLLADRVADRQAKPPAAGAPPRPCDRERFPLGTPASLCNSTFPSSIGPAQSSSQRHSRAAALRGRPHLARNDLDCGRRLGPAPFRSVTQTGKLLTPGVISEGMRRSISNVGRPPHAGHSGNVTSAGPQMKIVKPTELIADLAMKGIEDAT